MTRAPGRRPGSENSAREDYADAMIDVQSRCRDDGRSFFAEMTTLLAAWLESRRALGHRDDLVTVEVPEPDAGEASPAHALYQSAVGRPPVARLAEPDPRPAPRKRRAYSGRPGIFTGGPARDQLNDLLAGRVPTILVEAGKVKLSTLRVRCCQVAAEDPTWRLKVHPSPDGSCRIERIRR
jgi:hypothetical protein